MASIQTELLLGFKKIEVNQVLPVPEVERLLVAPREPQIKLLNGLNK